MIVVSNNSGVRKAAAFLEKVHALENEFGMFLSVGDRTLLPNEVIRFGQINEYGVVRDGEESPLLLVLMEDE